MLARGDAVDRPQAESDAQAYYEGLPQDVDANDVLDPRQIRDWVDARRVHPEEPVALRDFTIEAALARPAADYLRPRLTVAPLDADDSLIWVDPAGYTVARSEIPYGWREQASSFDFELIVADSTIVGESYLRHA